MSRRHDPKDINLSIDGVYFAGHSIYIDWVSDIGWGSYEIEVTQNDDEGFKVEADSEHMDSNDDKAFVAELMRLLVEKMEILG